MRITIALASEADIVSVMSSHLGYDGRYVPRQAPISAPVVTTTIDYPSVAASVTASRPSVASNPTIVIPFLSPSTTTPASSTLSTSSLSSQNAITSIPTYSLSPTASPSPSAQITTAPSPFKFIYLIPAIAFAGVLLGGLIGWVLYGCMTRKPRVRGDDGALLIGPRYIGINEPECHHIQDHDTERRREPTQMKIFPGAIPASPHFRWPSFNEKPAFHPVRGFHVPNEYLHDDDPPLTLPLATCLNTNVNVRTKSAQTTRTSKSVRTFKSTGPATTGPSRNVLPSPTSDTTSLALLELYESDEEEETRRKACEVPWESLRHKSIKRGIIAQVKKEGKWMDSIRGLTGSTSKMEEDDMLLGGPDADDIMEVDNYVGRRRGYSVPDSDPFADSPIRTYSISPKKRPTAKSRRTDSTTTMLPASIDPHGVGFQIIPESVVTTPNHSPRRSFAWLKKDEASNALEKFTRLPTPIPGGPKQSQSQSRTQSSRSTTPVKRTPSLHGSQVPRRDILPRSPAQIMSPPLHSQICFTPIPASSARAYPQSSRDYHCKSRLPVTLSPTRPLMVSSASKGKRKTQSPHDLHRLPRPPPSANTVVLDVHSSQREVSRGRVLQRPDSAATNVMKQVVDRSKRPGNIITAETRPDILEDPIKKVEQIMASSWSARDLGQGGMRSLSPTGFGRRA